LKGEQLTQEGTTRTQGQKKISFNVNRKKVSKNKVGHV